jgi:stress response protein YsnF
MLSNDNIAALIGTTAYDSEGAKIGKVAQVFVDRNSGRPSFASVHTGLFGMRESFVPIEQAEWDGGEDLKVPFTKDVIKDAPKVDAEGSLLPSEERELYRYYSMDDSVEVDDSADVDDSSDVDDGADLDDSSGRHAATGPQTRVDDVPARQDDDRESGRHVDEDDVQTPVAASMPDDGSMVRSEERVSVGTERMPTERVRLKRYTVTEQETVTVPVTHEEVRVEYEPTAGDAVDGDVPPPDTQRTDQP